ncbi:DUF2924 domain-containing protein [Thalassoglobus sp.]|uniref:DUF2924 domain-containing protein n=1 Tax=Thalassoglobus sp. TaxID=2795869 RepID=UPI003AA92C39
MPLDIDAEVAEMESMTITKLSQRYEELFHEPARSGNRIWLIKRIAWRLQANEFGDLSERARQRALEIADDREIRIKAPTSLAVEPAPSRIRKGKINVDQDRRLPVAGAVIERKYKGNTYRVLVLEEGFEYQNQVYNSLSAVAKAITGSHWNGYLFFRLKKGGAQ